MPLVDPRAGLGTLVTHACEQENAQDAHVTPIYQTSTFIFPDAQTGAARFKGEEPGYIYTRLNNPNLEQLARKIALLEGIDLLRERPQAEIDEVASGYVFASGMAAITAALLAKLKGGETVIAQERIYSNTYTFLHDVAPEYGIRVVWVKDARTEDFAAALERHPEAGLVYAESPANPTLSLVDLAALAELAHGQGAWLMVDNTFATPYCQRPLALGADIVAHSTTKYLSGHGLVIGGALVCRDPAFVKGRLYQMFRLLGSTPSPFDAWLANIGLKTFEVRMQRHCANALAVACYLAQHPKVEAVHYPGLESHPNHDLALKQMGASGAAAAGGPMMAFELKGGFRAGVALMEHVRLSTLAVSLGNVDALISHPASMTHSAVPREERLIQGITDGLVRYSVGIENADDLIGDFEQALQYT